MRPGRRGAGDVFGIRPSANVSVGQHLLIPRNILRVFAVLASKALFYRLFSDGDDVSFVVCLEYEANIMSHCDENDIVAEGSEVLQLKPADDSRLTFLQVESFGCLLAGRRFYRDFEKKPLADDGVHFNLFQRGPAAGQGVIDGLASFLPGAEWVACFGELGILGNGYDEG